MITLKFEKKYTVFSYLIIKQKNVLNKPERKQPKERTYGKIKENPCFRGPLLTCLLGYRVLYTNNKGQGNLYFKNLWTNNLIFKY